MAAPDKADRTVFVGNIPYDLSEELIIETLSRVGQVLSFRLVHDRETGNPKGFGFAEYPDYDSAASAIRNLNDYELAGRKLRVDWSNEGGASGGGGGGARGNNSQQQQSQQPQNTAGGPAPNGTTQDPSAMIPPLPPGADLPPDLTCPDAISRTLKTLPAPQLLDILSQMKGLVTTEPARATELLRQAPQLSYAIFQSLLLLGLVDTSTLAAVVEQAAAAQAPPPPQAPPPVVPQAGAAAAFNPYSAQPTPVQQPYAPPPVPPPPQVPQQNKEQLLQAVMGLTQQQIDALGPAERQQILALRNQILSGQF